MLRIFLLPLAIATVARACALPGWPTPEPAPAPPPPPPEYEFEHPIVWTANSGVAIRGDSTASTVGRPFTALAVRDADSVWITVECETCDGTPVGRVRHDEVVYVASSPAEAAHGTLAGFALAVRDAAERSDLAALAPVMADDFTFALVGLQGADRARAAWAAEGFRVLSQVPALLDRGLSPAGTRVWIAPPEFAESMRYHGLRLGFRRSAHGQWEWIFLVRGQGVPQD